VAEVKKVLFLKNLASIDKGAEMDRNTVDWKGYWPACPTPFHKSGEIDFDSFDKLIDWYLERKMHGLFINGTTGEWFSQSIQERKEIANFVAKKVGNKVPTVIGVTTFTAKESIDLAEHAMAAGISGICSSAPAYSKTLPDETVAYFKTISDAVKAPLMIYNWPHGTNIEISGELAARLADIDTVVAIKDSTPNADQFRETTKNLIDKVRIFGNFMVPENLEFKLKFGGDGTIGGGSIFGLADSIFWENVWSGNIDEAMKHAKLNEALLSALWAPGGWAGKFGAYQSQLKAIMKIMGVPGGEVRPPRLPLTDPQSIEEIRKVLLQFDVIK
jgi:4-hydroxy-tetrahydrodipicolinate synthase